MTKINKTLGRQFQDLVDHLEVLDRSIIEYKQGNLAFYKSILSNLRVLIAEEEGLLERFINLFSIKASITFPGLEGIPPTNPLSKNRTILFKDYLNDEIILDGRHYSMKKFIWRISSEDGSHADPKLSSYIASGELIEIGGIPSNIQQVLAIAVNTTSVGKSVVDYINKNNLIKD